MPVGLLTSAPKTTPTISARTRSTPSRYTTATLLLLLLGIKELEALERLQLLEELLLPLPRPRLPRFGSCSQGTRFIYFLFLY